MATGFFYPHIFTGSVGRRILLVVPVDTLYRTSIISSSTVLPLNPFVNLSLAPLSLFSIYGPDLEVWPNCWVSGEFLHAPIPRKGSGSTTTTRLQMITHCIHGRTGNSVCRIITKARPIIGLSIFIDQYRSKCFIMHQSFVHKYSHHRHNYMLALHR